MRNNCCSIFLILPLVVSLISILALAYGQEEAKDGPGNECQKCYIEKATEHADKIASIDNEMYRLQEKFFKLCSELEDLMALTATIPKENKEDTERIQNRRRQTHEFIFRTLTQIQERRSTLQNEIAKLRQIAEECKNYCGGPY